MASVAALVLYLATERVFVCVLNTHILIYLLYMYKICLYLSLITKLNILHQEMQQSTVLIGLISQ